MAHWIPFYDQIFDYFSTHFWLYHPGDPNHSEFSIPDGPPLALPGSVLTPLLPPDPVSTAQAPITTYSA